MTTAEGNKELVRRLYGGLMAKGEYVDQKFFGYPPTNVKNGGRFQGFMLEGVVAF